MNLREKLRPNSSNQLLFVVIGWVSVAVVISRVFNTPLVRLEILFVSVILFIWVIWGIHSLLENQRQERYRKR